MMSSMSNMFICIALSCFAELMTCCAITSRMVTLTFPLQLMQSPATVIATVVSGRGPCGHLGQTKHVSVSVRGAVN